VPEPTDATPRNRDHRPNPRTSLALLVAEVEPASLVDLVEGALREVASAGRLEVLVADDHASHQRRELLEAVDCLTVRTRLVPRPDGGRTGALDVLSAAASSEFVVAVGPGRPRLGAVDGALERMWTAGADAATLGAAPLGRADLPPGARVAEVLGVGGRPVPDAAVVLRRWVARWLLDDVASSLDPAAELADRARLLGMGLVEVPVPHRDHPTVRDGG